jgi:hypothetical protein
MSKNSFQTDTASTMYNSNGDLLLQKAADGTTNDALWMEYIQTTLLVSYAPIKLAYDNNLDLAPLPDIDPNAWTYPPIVADLLAIPPIVGYIGRRQYPIGADGYPTVEADIQLRKDNDNLDKKRLERETLNQNCMTRILKTIPDSLKQDIRQRDPDFDLFSSSYRVLSLVLCIREALTLSSANNALTLIKKVMNPTFSAASSITTTRDAQVIKQTADQLILQFPLGTTVTEVIHGFALAGLITQLDPVIFSEFLSTYNRTYPSGLGPTLHSIRTHHLRRYDVSFNSRVQETTERRISRSHSRTRDLRPILQGHY